MSRYDEHEWRQHVERFPQVKMRDYRVHRPITRTSKDDWVWWLLSGVLLATSVGLVIWVFGYHRFV